MGSRMKKQCRPCLAQQPIHRRLVAHARDGAIQLHMPVGRAQLLLDRKECGFAAFHEDKPRRTLLGYLAAQFAPDTAAGSRDHDDFPFDQIRDARMIQIDRIASEQILRIDMAQVAHRDLAVKKLSDGRENIVIDSRGVHLLDQLLDDCRLGFGHRDDDFVQIQFLDQRTEPLGRTKHGPPVKVAANFLPIIIDEAHHVQPQAPASLHISKQRCTRCTGTDDGRPPLLRNSFALLRSHHPLTVEPQGRAESYQGHE